MHNRIIISFVTAGLLSLAPHASGQQPSGDAVDKYFLFRTCRWLCLTPPALHCEPRRSAQKSRPTMAAKFMRSLERTST